MKSSLLRAILLFTGLCIYSWLVYAFGRPANGDMAGSQVESVSMP